MSYSTSDGPENWGKIRLEGDDDLSMSGSVYMRNLGMGIEGRPVSSGSASQPSTPAPTSPSNKTARQAGGMSWSSSKASLIGSLGIVSGNGKARELSTSSASQIEDVDDYEVTDRRHSTILSILQTFHTHACFQLSVLESFIPCSPQPPPPGPDSKVYLTPKDVLAFELGALSSIDARYLEWLSQEYGGGWTVVVKRGWKDLLSALLGY